MVHPSTLIRQMRARPARACCLLACSTALTVVPLAGVQAQSGDYQPENFLTPASRATGSATIQAVEVKGTQRVDPETVRSYLPLKAGDVLTPAAQDSALKALYKTGLFADVRLRREGAVLVVEVQENPVINTVAFEGHDHFSTDTLRQEVQLVPRAVYSRTRVQEDTQRLLELYRRSGRYAAVITPKIIQMPQNRVNVVFEIDEGSRTKVGRIAFVGNREFSDASLRRAINTKESAWYRLLTSDDTYDPERMAYDEELLRQHYLENGYIDFSVVSSIAELSPDKKAFYLTYTVQEGERYRVSDVDFTSSVREVDAAAVAALSKLEKGEWYNARRVEKTIDDISEYLGNLGYAFVEVKPELDVNRKDNTVGITFAILEGPKVYVDNINITGNVRTLDRVVRREFELAEGDAYNAEKLRRSERNIRNLGFFKDVQIKQAEGDAPDKTDIDVHVEEQSTGELSFGAGFSSTESFLGDIRLRESNFLGRGQDVKIATTFSGRRQEIDFGFTEPYFLGRDLSAGVDLFHVTRQFQQESSYDERRTGGALRLGYTINENLFHSLRYSLRQVSIEDVAIDASRFIREQEGEALTSAVGHELLWDYRDNRFEPSSGYYTRLTNEVAGLGGDVNYVRSTIGSGFFYPLADEDWVLGLETETGYTFGWGDSEKIRINDRFFVGGTNLRGFQVAGIGPRDEQTSDALGGNLYFTSTAEVRFPLGLDDLGVTGSAFVDAGTLSQIDNREPGVNYDNSIRVAGGVGLSWRSPFGPVRVDFAQPVLKEDFDRTEFFRFNFGTRF